MKWMNRLALVVTLVAFVYGVYSDVAPASYPLLRLPTGMGVAFALISGMMGLIAINLEKEREARDQQRSIAESFDRALLRGSASIAMHDKDFYALFGEQVRRASAGVDVTNLTARPPGRTGEEAEAKYFRSLRETYSASSAQIRRVERITEEKKAWVSELIKISEGLTHVSLALYEDPFGAEMPTPMSVCRVDNQYAWLVALAEHTATTSYRDLLITGADNVELIRRYFQDRLWARSILVVDRGVVSQQARQRFGV